ncbi:MAG: hypothetical protein CMH41_09965 [Micrococcales bacterium]|nr:hypothetical protein [Micrococcales bacterium]
MSQQLSGFRPISVSLGAVLAATCLLYGGIGLANDDSHGRTKSPADEPNSGSAWIDPPPPPESGDKPSRQETTNDPPQQGTNGTATPEQTFTSNDAEANAESAAPAAVPSLQPEERVEAPIAAPRTPLYPDRDLLWKSSQRLATPMHP